MNRYTHLFTPITVGNQKLKNRIFSAPTGLMSLTPEGHLTMEDIAYYERKAKGGAAVVTLGESIVHRKTGQSHERQIAMDDPTIMPALSKTARAITRHGAVANIELSHGGKYGGISSIGGTRMDKPKAYGPSAEVTARGEQVYEMPVEIIHEIAESFGTAAGLAKSSGFGMVMVHAGHGWLFGQFLSKLENKRTDEYGGSLENRARILMMSLDAVRRAVGPGFPIQLRMNGSDLREGGMELAEYVELAKMVEDKIDLFNISCGSHEVEELFVRTHPSMFLEHGCNVHFAEAIKKVVKKPVSAVGALQDPQMCEDIIASGKADIVEMARALIADPDWPKKAFHGQEEDIRPCLRCFACLASNIETEVIRCAVNPIIGEEMEAKLYTPPTANPKKIVVAGGGPAGMQFAITASERGHNVTLYEATDSLGGALKFAEYVDFKHDLHDFDRYLINKVNKSKAKVVLNQRVTKELLDAENPDILIMAAGADNIIPPIPGIDLPHVVNATEAERDPSALGENIVVLGGGLVGCETAVSLGMAGKKVTIIEMREAAAPDANPLHGIALREELKKYVEVHTSTTGKEITKEGIRCAGPDGKDLFVPADTVICAVGMRSRDGVEAELRDPSREQYLIGDLIRPGQVTQAIYSAYWLAMDL